MQNQKKKILKIQKKIKNKNMNIKICQQKLLK